MAEASVKTATSAQSTDGRKHGGAVATSAQMAARKTVSVRGACKSSRGWKAVQTKCVASLFHCTAWLSISAALHRKASLARRPASSLAAKQSSGAYRARSARKAAMQAMKAEIAAEKQAIKDAKIVSRRVGLHGSGM